MTPRPLLLTALMTLPFAGWALPTPRAALLNERTQQEIERLNDDPAKHRARINEINAITREFSEWQSREDKRDAYASLSAEDRRELVRKFRSVIKEEAVTGLQGELEAEDTDGWEDRLAEFWRCYRDPKACKSKRG